MRSMLLNEESKESVLNLFEKILNVKMKEAELKQAEWDTKGLKPKKDEIIEAFKHNVPNEDYKSILNHLGVNEINGPGKEALLDTFCLDLLK